VSRSARQAPLADRWKQIRLAVFDVDGVLTDGTLAIAAAQGAATVETKTFHVLDGHGIKQIARAGVEVAWISGRDSPVVAARARELGVTRLHQGVGDKLPVLQAILDELTIGFDLVLCIGDDLADLPLMRRCAIAFTVPHAPAAVKLQADAVTRLPGGAGAVRDLCDRLLHGIGRHDLLDEPDR
jgi:3-deoxy-D-manno-octulosonate 8-phosphate phosphatase (KDO 8-P phosphatase)